MLYSMLVIFGALIAMDASDWLGLPDLADAAITGATLGIVWHLAFAQGNRKKDRDHR